MRSICEQPIYLPNTLCIDRTPNIFTGIFREFTEGFNATCLIYHDETFKGDESNHEILKLKLKYIMIIRLVSF